MKRQKKNDKSIILLVVIILLVAGAAAALFFKFRTDKITESIEEGRPFTVAYMFTADSKLLFTEIVSYHPVTHKGAVLDIPGNTGMIIESLKRIDRIDVLHEPGKPGPYLDKVETLIGIEIDHFIELDLENLSQLVDLMGGLEMFIANPVEKITDDEVVLIPSGGIRLDGSKLKTYLTFESPQGEEEFEDTNRYQKFLQTFLKKMGESGEELINPHVFPYLQRFVETDLDKSALQSYCIELGNLAVDRLVFQRVLGASRIVDGKTLLFPHYDGKLLKESVKQTSESLANEDVSAANTLTVSLEILNATNKNGLAARTAQLFKSFGYEIAHVGNADEQDLEKTVVIDRKGDINKAQKVASLIDCKNIENPVLDPALNEEEDGNSDVLSVSADVTLILGNDFDGRYCKE